MIPVAWCGSIDRLYGRRRSKFLYRRVDARAACYSLFDLDALHFLLDAEVEARAACYNLFALDALHVLEDAEELRSALNENYEQDNEKLRLRLSTRQKKKRRKSKELPRRQWTLLSTFSSDVVSLKGKPKMGFDLLQTLKEALDVMTS